MLGLAAAFHGTFIARTPFRWHGKQYFVLFDDAMISMRFARNLAHGHGLVWNVHGPPVEGFTNPGWTLWMTVIHLFGIPEQWTSLAVMICSSLTVLVTVVLVYRICETIAPDNRAAGVAAAVLCASWFPLAYWSLRGMEVGAVACLVAWGVLAALRYQESGSRRALYQLVAALLLLELMRLDALVPACIIAAWAVWQAPRGRRRSTIVVLGGSLVGLFVAMTIGRLAYYGSALPNTYYLKATGRALSMRVDEGMSVFVASLTVALFPLVAAAGFALVRWWRTRQPVIVLLAALCLAAGAYSVGVGGDAWEATNVANRYLTSLAPAAVVLAGLGLGELAVGPVRRRLALAGTMTLTTAYGLHRFATSAGRTPFFNRSPGIYPFTARSAFETAAVLCVLVGLVLLGAALVWRSSRAPTSRWWAAAAVFTLVVVVGTNAVTWTEWKRHNAPYLYSDTRWAKEGLGIRASTRPDAMVALYAAGAIAYFDHRPAADAYGKVDPHIAHEKPDSNKNFRPGHDKSDLAWTIERWKPDLFEQAVAGWPPEQRQYLLAHGYVFTTNRFPVRANDPSVDIAKLVKEVPLPPPGL